MSDYSTQPLSRTDIRAIEARAHELRARAMRDMLQALVQGIASVTHKLISLVLRPRHA